MTDRSVRASLGAALAALLCLAGGAALALRHPIFPAAALVGFLAWVAWVAWRPAVWLFVVPAALPLLNFGPWTGWIVVEEFDLLLAGAAAGAYARAVRTRRLVPEGARGRHRDSPAFVAAASIFGLASVLALLRAASASGGWTFDLFQSEADPLNSWRVFKSVGFAALLWPLLRREIRADREAAMRRLAAGMVAGLSIVGLAVVWERTAYPGFWDFSTRYRTTALFWEMHVGGAALDAYLALAVPFVAWGLWSARSWPSWLAAAALALLTGHACLTTFSRGVYVAVALPLILLGVLMARRRALERLPGRRLASVALGLALTLEVVSVLGLGTFMRERATESDADFGSRLEHWGRGISFMGDPAAWFAGIGLGRLPAAYGADAPISEFPGSVRFVSDAPGQGRVQLSGPGTRADVNGVLALTQRVALRPRAAYRASFDIEGAPGTVVSVSVCELHLLYPRACQGRIMRIVSARGEWRSSSVALRGPSLTPGQPWMPRLAVFSIAVVNAGGVAQFDNLGLRASAATELLANGGFSHGLAHWFPLAQRYFVPWHIDNLYLEILVERGLLALLAFVAALGLVLGRLLKREGRTAAMAPFLAASVAGATLIGLVVSIMDAPRVAFLLLLLMVAAFEYASVRAPTRQPVNDRSRPSAPGARNASAPCPTA
jgi:O-antigen ligase